MKNLNMKKMMLVGFASVLATSALAQNSESEYELSSSVVQYRTGGWFKDSDGHLLANNLPPQKLQEALQAFPELIVTKGGEKICNSRERSSAGLFRQPIKQGRSVCVSNVVRIQRLNSIMQISFPFPLYGNSENFQGLSAPQIEEIRLSELSASGQALVLETKININGWESVLRYGSPTVNAKVAFAPSSECSLLMKNTGNLASAIAKMRSSNLENLNYCVFRQVGPASSTEYTYDQSVRDRSSLLVLRRDGQLEHRAEFDERSTVFLRPKFQNDPAKVLAARQATDRFVKMVGNYSEQMMLLRGSDVAEIRQAQKSWLNKNTSLLVAALDEVESNLASISGMDKALIMMTIREAHRIAREVESTTARQIELDQITGL